MNSIKLLAVSLPVIMISIACGMGSTSSTAFGDCNANVSGTITFQHRIALPKDTNVSIRIEDTSLADVPAKVIGEQVITTPGQVPIPYEVCYDPSKIDERFTYGMGVRITDGNGKLSWINDTHTPVITNGNPSQNVEIRVIQVGGKNNRTSSQ